MNQSSHRTTPSHDGSMDSVYAHADGRTYVACDADGAWWRWPAEAGGWRQKRHATADDADPDREYDAFHARLALRLSGAPCDDEEATRRKLRGFSPCG